MVRSVTSDGDYIYYGVKSGGCIADISVATAIGNLMPIGQAPDKATYPKPPLG